MNKTSRSNLPVSNLPVSEGTHDDSPRRPDNADSRLDSLRNEIRGSRQRVVSSNQAMGDRQAMGDPEATGDDA